MPDLRSNTAQLVTVGPFLGLDGVTPKLALTAANEKLTLIADIDQGTPGTVQLDANATASGGSNDLTHIAGDDAGYYLLEVTAANVNFIGVGRLSINDLANHLPVFDVFNVLSQAEFDRKYRGSLAAVNVTQVNGTAQTAGDLVVLINSIIAKTNNLPTDPADASDLAASFAAITTLLNTISGKTANLPTDPADASDLAASFAALTTLINAVSAKTVNLPADPADASDIAASFATLTGLINAISAKTTNLPPDPADASDISAAFGTVNASLSAMSTVVNTINSKTTALPVDPADASDIAAAFAALTTLINAVSAKTVNLPPDPADASDIAAAFATLTGLINAVSAKTTNLPADPADASDIAASFATLTTLVNSISAKTGNLPSDPADASVIAASFAAIVALLGTPAVSIAADIAAPKTLTTGERTAVANALLDLADGVEPTLTVREFFREVAATQVGLVTGLPNSPRFRDHANTKDRITGITDDEGNRLAITRDLT